MPEMMSDEPPTGHERPSPFRVVMLTNGSPYGLELLREFARRGHRITAVVYESRRGLAGHVAPLPTPFARLLDAPRAPWRWLRYRRHIRRAADAYALYVERVVVTGELNSERMRRDLAALEPDFIVLGGIGIIKAPLIETARRGVLNAHPALLPWVRGAGVVAHAVRMGVPIGVTCHYVNAGIDRGAVIERRLLPFAEGETSLQQVEAAAERLAVEVLADIVAGQLSEMRVPKAFEQRTKHPLCRWLPPEESREVDAEIRAGRARELFEQWRPLCLDGDKFRLPPNYEG